MWDKITCREIIIKERKKTHEDKRITEKLPNLLTGDLSIFNQSLFSSLNRFTFCYLWFMPVEFLQKNPLKGARKESCSCCQDYLITWFNKQFKTLYSHLEAQANWFSLNNL